MEGKQVNKELVGLLTNEHPDLYILTNEHITGAVIPPFTVDGVQYPEYKLNDALIKHYHNYKYDDATQSLQFELKPNDVSYSVCLPYKYISNYPKDVRCYYGHMINDSYEYDLTEKVNTTKRFLKKTDWTDTLSLTRFKVFYYFKYYRTSHLILSAEYMRVVCGSVWKRY